MTTRHAADERPAPGPGSGREGGGNCGTSGALRRELIGWLVVAALAASSSLAPHALARGGDQDGGGGNGQDDGKKNDDGKKKGDGKKDGEGKQDDEPKTPEEIEKERRRAVFRAAYKAAKDALQRKKDGVAELLKGLGDKDSIKLELTADKQKDFSKKQAASHIEDWFEKNTLTIKKKKSEVEESSVTFAAVVQDLSDPKERSATVELQFAWTGAEYRLRSITIAAK